ncbi:MAG: hypothetical protein DI630_31030 [Gordonia sp. (in: high G+C Gram-positive bacteria)]|nr:MAG: hypothetical protein DI630_31030 [Gordonia sp. (in: high G+C Gram-positive bacteria)]
MFTGYAQLGPSHGVSGRPSRTAIGPGRIRSQSANYGRPSVATTGVDRGEIRRRLLGFSSHWSDAVQSWRSENTPHTEKSFAHSFWTDLLDCFGVNAARRDLFERDAVRATTGRGGYIDVFQSGVFIGEAKSLGADLEAAHRQALDYLAGGSIGPHEFPKYVVVTDFARLHIDHLGDSQTRVEFDVADIADHLDALLFLAGHETITRREEEDALYTYYGNTAATGNGKAEVPLYDQDADRRDDVPRETTGYDTTGPTTDDAMTRSEEQLRVGTEQVETGRARLRKHIVTEQVTKTVPVSHEEVTVTREPITEANVGDALAGGELTSEEHEVVLTGERVVTSKETVPVERVSLGTKTVTDQQQVTEDVSHEEIELIDPDVDGTPSK